MIDEETGIVKKDLVREDPLDVHVSFQKAAPLYVEFFKEHFMEKKME